MKCTNGHDIAEGQTHCTECDSAATGLITKAVHTCGFEGLTTHKFCGGCGESLVVKAVTVTQDELDKGLDALGLIAKANAALDDDIIPEGAEGDDEGEGDDVLTLKSELLAPSADGSIDALPILDLLLKAVNRQATIIQAQGRELRAMRKDIGVQAESERTIGKGFFVKAHGLFEKIEALDQRFSEWAGLPKPRKAQVELINKAIVPGDGRGEQDTSLTGTALIAKAVSLENQGLLQVGDASRVNHFANRGLSLDAIKIARPDLHGRLVSAIGAQKQQGQ